ncbi:MAG: hypothetical protein ABS35_40965 [Kaistia sp. SCN 65-12]|nr:MAG: hypothetical protein ABS35_40965 [Kaistia sp. SCN 65-12]
MNAAAGTRARRPARKAAVFALVALVAAVFFGANAHLVYVAFTSQPDCVPHAKEVGVEGAPLRAARSAC